MISLRLDDRELLYIWAQLSERDRMKALRNPTRRAANAVRRAAQNSIKSAGIHNAAAIARTVRIANFKQVLGFKVALRNRGQKAMHITRHDRQHGGKGKPLAFWFGGGTAERFTRKTKLSRGRLTKYGFMDAAHAANATAVQQITDGMAQWIERLGK